MSITNGHGVIRDNMPPPSEPALQHLQALAFVKALTLQRAQLGTPDTTVTVRTPARTFTLDAGIKHSFLDRTTTNAIIAAAARRERPLLLIARYVPRPTAERLISAGVNFVDRSGSLHLALGSEYHATLVGRRDDSADVRQRRKGPAHVQVLFVLLVHPDAATWPVRKLASAAGISKSAASLERTRLLHENRDRDPKWLAESFVAGSPSPPTPGAIPIAGPRATSLLVASPKRTG